MLRVIGGSVKGRKLKTPRGLESRPTSQRVREALFDILGADIEGASFLDLFAGTGAVGIEAISRGAENVVLVERDRQVCKLIRENLIRCNFSHQAHVWAKDARTALDSDRFRPFDIIFIDPPYDTNLAGACLARLDRMPEKVQTVVVEQENNLKQTETAFFPRHLRHIRDYRYGRTVLSFLAGNRGDNPNPGIM